jgi:hypothetical protein
MLPEIKTKVVLLDTASLYGNEAALRNDASRLRGAVSVHPFELLRQASIRD